MIIIQPALRIAPYFCQNDLLAVLFGSSGNLYKSVRSQICMSTYSSQYRSADRAKKIKQPNGIAMNVASHFDTRTIGCQLRSSVHHTVCTAMFETKISVFCPHSLCMLYYGFSLDFLNLVNPFDSGGIMMRVSCGCHV
jgi:hypothetical protein